ncbi:hypothetical protein P389DRAFT_67342 [Cystobasidium minutum MCA 4210]|uniref:uncharacterized protein n=1 Tax=Cystobasidium minutum MCA 4210 TaxID=1397322 RepID=UPI0034CD2B52|eukprot:jgi/Rhomi1/67342/CE67341_537
MRALPHFQVVDDGNGVVQYAVTSRTGLTLGWLELLLLEWLAFLRYSSNDPVPSSWLAVFCPVLAWYTLKRQTRRQESLLVMKAVGVQLSSQVVLHLPVLRARCIKLPLSSTSKTFIPASSIQDIVLLEGLQGWSIIWYLAVAQQESNGTKLHVIFPHALPRLAILRRVWQDARSVLGL